MVLLEDKEITMLNMQRHSLIRKLDRKEVSQEEYDEKMTSILEKLKEKKNKFFKSREEDNKQMEGTTSESKDDVVAEVKKKMAKEEQEKNISRKPVTDSKASFIAKALMMKTVKSFDDVAVKVAEWKPGIDKDKIIKFAKVIVREVKKGKQPRWQKYSWNEENFQLTEI